MTLEDQLFAIDEGFWLRGRDHFLAHLDDKALVDLPQAGEMHGVFEREQIAANARTFAGWRDLRMVDRQFVHCGEVAIISYKADVTGVNGVSYSALVSSGYFRRDDGWKLGFHQHSPL